MKRKKISTKKDELTLIEKILFIEDMWDSKAKNNSLLSLQQWQKKELEKRKLW